MLPSINAYSQWVKVEGENRSFDGATGVGILGEAMARVAQMAGATLLNSQLRSVTHRDIAHARLLEISV